MSKQTRVVVRLLPPTLTRQEFENQLIECTNRTYILSYYVEGNVPENKFENPKHSRCYFTFKSTEEAEDFVKEVSQKPFVDADKNSFNCNASLTIPTGVGHNSRVNKDTNNPKTELQSVLQKDELFLKFRKLYEAGNSFKFDLSQELQNLQKKKKREKREKLLKEKRKTKESSTKKLKNKPQKDLEKEKPKKTKSKKANKDAKANSDIQSKPETIIEKKTKKTKEKKPTNKASKNPENNPSKELQLKPNPSGEKSSAQVDAPKKRKRPPRKKKEISNKPTEPQSRPPATSVN